MICIHIYQENSNIKYKNRKENKKVSFISSRKNHQILIMILFYLFGEKMQKNPQTKIYRRYSYHRQTNGNQHLFFCDVLLVSLIILMYIFQGKTQLVINGQSNRQNIERLSIMSEKLLIMNDFEWLYTADYYLIGWRSKRRYKIKYQNFIRLSYIDSNYLFQYVILFFLSSFYHILSLAEQFQKNIIRAHKRAKQSRFDCLYFPSSSFILSFYIFFLFWVLIISYFTHTAEKDCILSSKQQGCKIGKKKFLLAYFQFQGINLKLLNQEINELRRPGVKQQAQINFIFFHDIDQQFQKDDLMLFPNIYIFYIRKVMCFLKKLRPLDEISHQKGNENPPAPYEETTKDTLDHSFLNELLNSKSTVVMSKGDQLLMNLTQLINFNNEQINMIEEKLQQNFQLISDLNSKVNEEKIEKDSHDCMKEENQSAHQSQETFVDHQNQVEPLIKRLFGKEKYQYRLELQEEFPTTIYKERNFNFSFALVNNNQEKILNSNIIHLCLGICDATGEWINENKAGENFMKGKTEIEMYHGEGSFVKVYPRDVSRHHPEGKINIVVYTKPSMIKFSNNASSVERIVSSEEIEPLLIKDITIKSKKKE